MRFLRNSPRGLPLIFLMAAAGTVAAVNWPRFVEQSVRSEALTEERTVERPAPVSAFMNWMPPAGIPTPPFGLRESAPAPPERWTSPVRGFYYVDAVHQRR
jgi:hypothetical protein